MKATELDQAIFEAIGETTALFMSNPLPGTEQVMPDQECSRIGHDLAMRISKMVLNAKDTEIERLTSELESRDAVIAAFSPQEIAALTAERDALIEAAKADTALEEK